MSLRILRITWGVAFVNTIDFRFPVDRPDPAPNVVGESAEVPSGLMDFWEEADHEEIRFRQTLIPSVDSGAYTGWYGATGVRAWFKSAVRKDQFRVIPDPIGAPGTYNRCQLVEGRTFRMETKAQFFGFEVRIRDLDGTAFEW